MIALTLACNSDASTPFVARLRCDRNPRPNPDDAGLRMICLAGWAGPCPPACHNAAVATGAKGVPMKRTGAELVRE